jgi:hypothetical protein
VRQGLRLADHEAQPHLGPEILAGEEVVFRDGTDFGQAPIDIQMIQVE